MQIIKKPVNNLEKALSNTTKSAFHCQPPGMKSALEDPKPPADFCVTAITL